MKKILGLLILLLTCMTNFAQGFSMYMDSTYVFGTNQQSFEAHRTIIALHKMSRCNIYAFYNENITDSALIKQVWFDSAGNLVKAAILKSGNPDSIAYSCNFSYDATGRSVKYESVINNIIQSISRCNYFDDTVEIIHFNYYQGGEVVFFSANQQKIEKKPGWDTTYTQSIFNKIKQLLSSSYLDNSRHPIQKWVLSYNSKGLPYKSYAVGEKKQKKFKFLYTHEFTNGQYVMMKWDDGPQRMMKNDLACFYQNNQCIQCTQPFGTFWEFFYTTDGLLSEERQSINKVHTVSYKYYYY